MIHPVLHFFDRLFDHTGHLADAMTNLIICWIVFRYAWPKKPRKYVRKNATPTITN